ncbi:MAG: hypothetical protein EOP58_12340 [Sphingomonadales bacterium]|nr:MAG: hypothetical protein EOP58_12340 [Sphingomonadales bacterium]
MLILLLPLLPILLAFGMFAVSRWRTTIIAVLVWTLFEGVVRKWVFPGYQAQILVAKDIVLLAAYLGYALTIGLRSASPSGPLLLLGGMFVAYCFVQLVNPNAPSMLLAVYGLKNYVVYMPLAIIIPDMIQREETFRRTMLWICILSIPISLLALYQFSQPPSHWVNQYVSHEEGVTSTAFAFGAGDGGDFQSGRARTSSTFSFLGGFSTFLVLMVPMAQAMLLSGMFKGRALLLVAGSLALALGATLTTGSRAPIYVYAAVMPVMMLLGAGKGLVSLTTALRFTLVIAVIGGGASFVFGSALDAYEYRAANSDNPLERLLSPINEPLRAFETSPLIGTGIGTTSNASASIMQSPDAWWLGGYAYEAENARVMQELGFPGFFLLYLLKIYVVLLIYRFYRRSRRRANIALHLQALSFTAIHLVFPTVNNPTGGLFYWAMVGLAIAADRVEWRAWRSAATLAPSPPPIGAHAV